MSEEQCLETLMSKKGENTTTDNGEANPMNNAEESFREKVTWKAFNDRGKQ